MPTSLSHRLSSGAASALGALAFAIVAAMPVTAQADLLFDNGSASTGPVTRNGTWAPEGTTWAESQGGTIGWSNSVLPSGNRVTFADDFTVAAGTSWAIDSFNFFAYVPDTGIESTPIAGVALRIWSGTPGTEGASVIWGDLSTNRMTSSTFSNIYRSELDYPSLERPLWDQTVSTAGLVLGEGSYWVEWITSPAESGQRALGVPVHVAGMTAAPGSNARQSVTVAGSDVTTWVQLVDTGVQQVQDLPFSVHGSVTAVPEPSTAMLWMLGIGALGAMARRRRSH